MGRNARKSRGTRNGSTLANPNHPLLPKIKKRPEIVDEATKKRQLAESLVVDGEYLMGGGACETTTNETAINEEAITINEEATVVYATFIAPLHPGAISLTAHPCPTQPTTFSLA
jgi:hypothetical protein